MLARAAKRQERRILKAERKLSPEEERLRLSAFRRKAAAARCLCGQLTPYPPEFASIMTRINREVA